MKDMDNASKSILHIDQPVQNLSLSNASTAFLTELRELKNKSFVPSTFDDDLHKALSNISATNISKVNANDQGGRVISFSTVVIREYPIIIGDNPSTRKGPPLSIAWNSISDVSVDIDNFEEIRGPNRRVEAKMYLFSDHRVNLLRSLGFSTKHIREGVKTANIGRRKRQKTVENLNLSGMHENFEYFKRNTCNLLLLGRRKKKEREYLKKHVPSYNKDSLDDSIRSTKAHTKKNSSFETLKTQNSH